MGHDNRDELLINRFTIDAKSDGNHINTGNRVKMQMVLNAALRSRLEQFKKELEKQLYGTEDQAGIDQLIAVVCRAYYVTPKGLFTRSRQRSLILPRQIVQWMLCRNVVPNGLSLAAIGLLTGGYDHATVLNSERQIDNLILTVPTFREEMIQMAKALNATLVWNPDSKTLTKPRPIGNE